ncbi:hypothetical protein Clacol_002230 [Clathrus columnatus]|uniref:Tetraspanin n=1 Tax=Clathrus columnatus TaxID=1419009 RepID=A0AAV5A5U0_9AGAM|nr:hypothetical protein Clacol_002230 [Clathrus columnatus]
MPPTVRFSEETTRSPSISTTPYRWSLAASEEDALSSCGSGTGSDDLNDRVALSLNYLPSKFSTPTSPHIRRRQSRGSTTNGFYLPATKFGGGRTVFKANEARMPALDENEEGEIPQDPRLLGKHLPALRWNRFKWALVFSNTILSGYSLLGLVCCLLTWFNVWENADVLRVANRSELIQSTFAASVAVVTSLFGWSGILLNNRPFLAIYTFLCWTTFAALVIPGYITYRHRTFNLDGKLNLQWSREIDLDGRLRIQNELECCGYFDPFVEAAVSQWCYSRSQFPGCKGPFLLFERRALETWYTIVFSLVPVQIGITVVGLLCSNHINYRFGKGMMPKPYRLSLSSMAIMMEKYAMLVWCFQFSRNTKPTTFSEIAQQYGFNSETLPTPMAMSSPTGTSPVTGFETIRPNTKRTEQPTSISVDNVTDSNLNCFTSPARYIAQQ